MFDFPVVPAARRRRLRLRSRTRYGVQPYRYRFQRLLQPQRPYYNFNFSSNRRLISDN